MRKISSLALMFFFVFGLVAACTSQTATRTVKTETVQYRDEPARDTAEQPVVLNSETTETTTRESESTGLLSGTVHAVGQVLALPFRAAGGLIDLIF